MFAFCDYHNMVAILEKIEYNTDFHQIVDFLKASHIRYALTISPIVYVSHIRQFWSTARIKTTDQETKITAIVDGKSQTIFESSLRRHLKLNDEEWISSLHDTELFENLSLMGYNILPNQSNITTAVVCLANNRVYNFSKLIFDGMVRNINREAFPTVSSLDAGQDKENIAKTFAVPHESSPRVHSLDADDGSMKQTIHELIELCTSLQRKQSKMADKIKDQDLEISRLKVRVKSLKDKERRSAEPTQEDASVTEGIIEIGVDLGADKSTELGSNDTKEMVYVLSSMEAVNIFSSGGAAASVSPADVFPTVGVLTVSGSFSIPMRTPILRAKDKGKEKLIETEVPKKRKLQEQIDAQVAREMEEEFARENQILSEQVARDYEIARIHAEEEQKMMIKGLDRSNEVIVKHLREYEQAEVDLSVGEKIYQDHRAKILKYQSQQSKPLSEKEQREFYVSVLRSHARWKTKHFEGMTLEQLKEKFIPVWKQWEDFVPMSSKEESERVKRQGLKIDLGSLKRATRDKEKELWVELKRQFEPDFEDQLWTYHQALMHDPLDWKLYDTCGVQHVSSKDQEIFMLVEKGYLLRKGLATVTISNKLQVEQYSQMASDLILKIHNIANSPR
nr:hypothetical protein [Tanacetum cinerariifolium]